MRSIRTRTLFLVLGVLTLSLSMISYKSYRDALHEIEELFDAQLAQSARLLAGLVGREMAEREREGVQVMLEQSAAGAQVTPACSGLRVPAPNWMSRPEPSSSSRFSIAVFKSAGLAKGPPKVFAGM